MQPTDLTLPQPGTPQPDAGHDPTSCGEGSCAQVPSGGTWMGRFLYSAPDGAVTFHHLDELHASVAATVNARFSALTRSYQADPADPAVCFNWLRLHPMFHRFVVPAEAGASAAGLTDEVVADWESARFLIDDDGLRDLHVSVDRDQLGQLQVAFEHGPHQRLSDVPTADRWQLPVDGAGTHDAHLDVHAGGFEQAYVTLAAKVYARYGTGRWPLTAH